MMTDRQLINWFLELQDHPEQITEEQLGELLNDGQTRKLMEQMAFTKRAFKYKEALDNELAVEEEWERFAATHSIELDALDEITPTYTQPEIRSHVPDMDNESTSLKPQFRKYAAVFIVVILASGIALAGIHIVRHVTKRQVTQQQPVEEALTTKESEDTTTLQHPTTNIQHEEADTLVMEPRVFDNVPLDTMLLEMASFYKVAVEFRRDEARQLRMHFDWKPTDDIDRVVERLNHFEAVNIIVESDKIIVK